MSGGEDRPLRVYCSICMGYHPTQAMRVLRCGHVFCEQAILGYWLTKKPSPASYRPQPLACPMCQGTAEHRRDARLDPRQGEEAWLEKCKLLLRRLYIDSACCAPPDDERDTVFLDDPGVASQLPAGASRAGAGHAYAVEVLAKAKDVSARFKDVDKSVDAKAVQRAADEMRQMYEMMDWEAQDPILDLFGALHDFIANGVVNAFKVVAEKDKQLRLKGKELRQMQKANDQLQSEADQRQRLLDKSESTAAQAWSKVRELNSTVEGLQEARASDKRKIKELIDASQTAKTMEAKLRKRLAVKDDAKRDLEKQLAALRQTAEQQQQENEDLRRHSGYQPSYDDPGEFVQGSSQDNYLYVDDIDLDSHSPDPYAPPAVYPTPPQKRAFHVPPPPKFPSSLSAWNLPTSSLTGLGKRQRIDRSTPTDIRAGVGGGASARGEEGTRDAGKPPSIGVRLDREGRPMSQVQLGPRTRLNRHN